jgi:hypothetical protein
MARKNLPLATLRVVNCDFAQPARDSTLRLLRVQPFQEITLLCQTILKGVTHQLCAAVRPSFTEQTAHILFNISHTRL